MKVDLNKFITSDVKVISGRDKGEHTRKVCLLDEVDQNDAEIVEVIIPERVWTMNSSFFLGCFGPSVRRLGEASFRKRFQFKCTSVILKNVEDGISRALNESNPLDKPLKC